MSGENIIFILDKIGIITFAFVGISIGIKKKLDIFGLILVGLSSAIGGGIIRDLLLSKTPYAISNIEYLQFAFAVCCVSLIIYYFKINVPARLILIADAIGLGAFAASGAVVSIENNLSIFHTVLLAITTGVGGGIIRDVLINDIPFILKREVYATAAGIGGLTCHLIYKLSGNLTNAIIAGVLITFIVRLVAVSKKYNLPIIK